MRRMKKALLLTAMAGVVLLAGGKRADAASQITNVQQTDDSISSVTVSWDANLACSGYRVEYSEDNATWYEYEDYTTSTSEYIYGLSAGKTYYVRVTGYQDWSWLSSSGTLLSETTSEVVDVVTAPSVTGFLAEQTDAATDSVTIEATEASSVNWYRVYDGYSKNTLVKETDANTIQITTQDYDLLAGTAYNYWYVYGCRKSSAGYVAEGSYCYDSVSFKTLDTKYKANEFGATTAYYSTDVYYFGIQRSSDVDSYQIQFLDTKGKSKMKINSTSTSIRVEGLNGTFYQYRVRSYVTCGTKNVYSAWSSKKYFAVPETVKAASDSGSAKIKLNWSKVSGATGYVVKVSKNSESGYKKAATVGASKRTATIKKVNGKKVKSGTYYIKLYVKAKIKGKTVTAEVPYSGTYIKY